MTLENLVFKTSLGRGYSRKAEHACGMTKNGCFDKFGAICRKKPHGFPGKS